MAVGAAARDRAAIQRARQATADARARGLALIIEGILAQVAADEFERLMADLPRLMSQAGAVSKARIVVRKAISDREAIARLTEAIRRYGASAGYDSARAYAVDSGVEGSEAANTARVILPAALDQYVRLKVPQLQGLPEATRSAVRSSVMRIIEAAIREPMMPSTGELARRIRTQYQGSPTAAGRPTGPGRVTTLPTGETLVQPTERGELYAISSERAAAIARTELRQIAGVADYAAAQALGAKELEWIAVTSDRRSGERRHWEMDGVRTPVGVPFTLPSGEKLRFPGDPAADISETINCLPGSTLVVARGVVAATRYPYHGPIASIVTRDGYTLSGTPNHPILTDKGWVPIGALDKGSKVAVSLRSVGQSTMSAMHKDDVPAPIQQVFDLLWLSGAEQRRAPADFHGDAPTGNVDIVFADRSLMLRGESISDQIGNEFPLSFAGRALRLFSRYCPFSLGRWAFLAAALRSIGRRSQSFALVSRHRARAIVHGLRSAARRDAPVAEDAQNDLPAAAVALRECLDTATLLERLSDRRGDAVKEALASCDPSQAGVMSGRTLADTELLSDISQLDPTAIRFDDIAHSGSFDWSGHVYNLQTEPGWYIAQGIIVHNCRCTMRNIGYKD